MVNSDGRLGVRIREVERGLLRALGFKSERDLEYRFVRRHILSQEVRILDVGGVGSLLPLTLARRGNAVTVCDVRHYPERHPNLEVVQGDFLTIELRESSFDVAVLVSTIEHVGFAHYGDPVLEDGDIVLMQRIRRVLKTDGKVILTTPFTAEERIIEGFERWYDLDRLSRVLSGFRITHQEFWIPKLWLKGRCIKWVTTSLEEAKRAETLCGYHATVCVVGERSL